MLATFVHPLGEGVFRVQVGLCRLSYGLRRVEALVEPVNAAFDRPPENPAPFCTKLLAEIMVALIGRDGDREWYEMEAPADRLVDGAQARLMIACNEEPRLEGSAPQHHKEPSVFVAFLFQATQNSA